MNRLQRYLFGASAAAGIVGISLFVFVLIAGNAMRDILGLLAEGQIPGGLFFSLLMLLVPYAISFAMPLGLLVGILLVMGRLSANHEITAMKAAGISVWTIAAPVLAVALMGTAGAAWINSYYAPTARASYRAILNNLVRSDPLRFIVPKTFIHDFPGYVLYVGEKEGGQLNNFWLWELDDEKRALRLLRADQGSFTYDEANDALVLTLRSGFTELRDAKNPDDLQSLQPTLSFRDARIRLPLENVLGSVNQPRKLSLLNMRELWQRKQYWTDHAASQTDPALREAALKEASVTRYYISRNFAMACSVFSLALLAIPLGIKVSRSETHANIGIALGLALSYYLALVIISWFEHQPAMHPEILVWLPNFVSQSAGLALLIRASR